MQIARPKHQVKSRAEAGEQRQHPPSLYHPPRPHPSPHVTPVDLPPVTPLPWVDERLLVFQVKSLEQRQENAEKMTACIATCHRYLLFFWVPSAAGPRCFHVSSRLVTAGVYRESVLY